MAAKRAGCIKLEERRSGQLERIYRQAVPLRRKWASMWRIPELRDAGKLQFNPRLTRTVARWVLGTRCLEVGPRFFESDRNQTAILCHEYAHAAAVLRFGPAVPSHGPEWRQFVRAAGFEPVTRYRGTQPAVRAPSHRRVRPLMFEHRCPICHSARFGRRKMTRWRCAQCVQDGLPGDLSIRVYPVLGAAS
jgi:hypothetical protein